MVLMRYTLIDAQTGKEIDVIEVRSVRLKHVYRKVLPGIDSLFPPDNAIDAKTVNELSRDILQMLDN